jgi:hypothetical protein
MDAITVPAPSSAIIAPDSGIELREESLVHVDGLVARWLARRSETTCRAYSSDLKHFAVWLGVPTSVDAVKLLLAAGHAGANEIVDNYVISLIQSELSSSATNRRLAAIRSIISLAQLRGLIDWTIDVSGVRVQPYRDTRGPGLHAVQAMLQVAAAQGGLKALRRRPAAPALRTRPTPRGSRFARSGASRPSGPQALDPRQGQEAALMGYSSRARRCGARPEISAL